MSDGVRIDIKQLVIEGDCWPQRGIFSDKVNLEQNLCKMKESTN